MKEFFFLIRIAGVFVVATTAGPKQRKDNVLGNPVSVASNQNTFICEGHAVPEISPWPTMQH